MDGPEQSGCGNSKPLSGGMAWTVCASVSVSVTTAYTVDEQPARVFRFQNNISFGIPGMGTSTVTIAGAPLHRVRAQAGPIHTFVRTWHRW
jgi:hypothetical protein